MPLTYHPCAGTIVLCDFRGLEAPEMVKRRPAVIVSPRHRRRGLLATVVPFSTTAPSKVEGFHYKLRIDPPLPKPWSAREVWVKADMLYTLSIKRMDRPHYKQHATGKRIYVTSVVSAADLAEIRLRIGVGLGMQID